MKYVFQFGVIMAVSFAGEIVRQLLPFKCPASIYGLIILFILLKAHVIKLEWVKETGNFLVEAMPIMFVPICVELMTTGAALAEVFAPVVVISVVTTFLVMAITGISAQYIIRRDKKKSMEKTHIPKKETRKIDIEESAEV